MKGGSNSNKKVLYLSASLGLGHISRDSAIASELRKQKPGIEISWLAAHPASLVLKNSGENLLPEAARYANDNVPAKKAAKGSQLNLLKYLTNARKDWERNVEIFKQISGRDSYDLIIGDETYELVVGMQKDSSLKKAPFVMIYDFIGLDAMTRNPWEKVGIYVWNWIWSKDFKRNRAPVFDLARGNR